MANFLFTLGQNDNEKATRCFQFAKIAFEKGHTVNVFFIDDGVKWARFTRDFQAKTATGDCPNDYLPYLVENVFPLGSESRLPRLVRLTRATFWATWFWTVDHILSILQRMLRCSTFESSVPECAAVCRRSRFVGVAGINGFIVYGCAAPPAW